MEEMRDLAHYFGRTAFQKEVAEQYEAIINRWSQELFEKVIQHIRNNEHITDFPKPFEMDRIGKKMNYEVRQGRPEYTGCEYCDDTGFIMRDDIITTANVLLVLLEIKVYRILINIKEKK